MGEGGLGEGKGELTWTLWLPLDRWLSVGYDDWRAGCRRHGSWERGEEIEGYRQDRMKSGELIYRTGRGGRSNIIILFSKFEEGKLRYVTVKGAAEDRPPDANSNQMPINSPDFLVFSAGLVRRYSHGFHSVPMRDC